MPIKEKLLFIHIPRSGGTYIEHLMGVHSERNDSGLGKCYNHSADLLNLFGNNLQHLMLGDYVSLLGINNLENFRLITIIRNPYDRLESVIKHSMHYPEFPRKSFLVVKVILKILFYKLGTRGFLRRTQIQVFCPVKQHLISSCDYLKTESKLPVYAYPFESLGAIHQLEAGCSHHYIIGTRPNKTSKRSLSLLSKFFIVCIVNVIWRKDLKLYKDCSQHFAKNRQPLIVNG